MAWIRWRSAGDGRRLATLQWRDESGVHSKALNTPSESVAQTYLRAFERSLGKRGPVRALKSTQDALDAYLDEKGLGARPATVQMCRANLEPLFTAWADVPMHQWSKAMFVRYITEKKAWSPRAIQMFVGDCRRFIRWAAADGSGVACPDFVGDFKCPAVHQKEPHHLEPEQAALLLADLKGTALEVPAALAALAGLRRAEFFGLDAKAIDWERQVLHVRSTKTHRDARVEISPALLEVLKRHRVTTGPVVRMGPHTRNGYRSLHAACRRIHMRLRAAKYLADPAAGAPRKRDAQRRARADWEAGDRAFPTIGWHTLRHSFATALLAKGVDLRTVQDLMRHKTAAMTMRYAHSTSERRRAAEEKVLAQLCVEAGLRELSRFGADASRGGGDERPDSKQPTSMEFRVPLDAQEAGSSASCPTGASCPALGVAARIASEWPKTCGIVARPRLRGDAPVRNWALALVQASALGSVRWPIGAMREERERIT